MSSRDHDRITTQFIRTVMRPVIIKPDGMPELMVITESLLFGVMSLLKSIYGMTPQNSVTTCEICLDQAIKRFARENERDMQ